MGFWMLNAEFSDGGDLADTLLPEAEKRVRRLMDARKEEFFV